MMHQHTDSLHSPLPLSNYPPTCRHGLVFENTPTLPENSFFPDSPMPATPQLTMSASSSFAGSSPHLISSSSSPATPVTEFVIPAPEWPLPRAPEKLNNLFIPLAPRNQSVNPTHTPSKSRDAIDEKPATLEYHLTGNFTGDKHRPASSPQSPHSQQKSGEIAVHSLSRFTSRLPSFNRKWRHRKNSSLSTGNSGETTKTPSSRSSSVTSGCEKDITSLNMPHLSRHNSSTMEMSPPLSPFNSSVFVEYDEDPIDRVRLSSTPLLPPKMFGSLTDEPVYQNPLKSPSIATESRTSSIASCENSPGISHTRGPSSKSSIASFQRRQRKNTNPSVEIPASLVPPTPDKWSDLLGHANFTIQPEPYLPISFDRASCLKLASDWEAARAEFFKQQARTLEHYGPNSKTYKLTEDKWAEIDAQWKIYIEQATANAVAQGEDLNCLINVRTNLSKCMPKFNPHIDGKFPILGDQNIVGPMEIVESISKPSSPTHKQSSSKLFKLGSLFGKGASDER